ncbi:hypothetical protein [Streptomyces sp. RK9]|uniref:hypothetical protein n=1 Tax=Streptomyces sp. RK9 TaxID=3239284 RepID=UPI00386D6F4A
MPEPDSPGSKGNPLKIAATEHLIAVSNSNQPEPPSATVSREASARFTGTLGKEPLP